MCFVGRALTVRAQSRGGVGRGAPDGSCGTRLVRAAAGDGTRKVRAAGVVVAVVGTCERAGPSWGGWRAASLERRSGVRVVSLAAAPARSVSDAVLEFRAASFARPDKRRVPAGLALSAKRKGPALCFVRRK